MTSDGMGGLMLLDLAGNSGVTVSPDGIWLGDRKLHDFAEIFELATREGVEPGTVLSAGREDGLAPSSSPYDAAVVGVVSGAGGLRPGLVLGGREDGTNDLPVALSGTVYVRVSAEGGALNPGDLLVTSSVPGLAMRADDQQRAFGAVIGKALEAWAPKSETESGLVHILVMAR
jgi:hypothetical protein